MSDRADVISVELRFDQSNKIGQFIDRAVDIVTLLFQLRDMRLAFLDSDPALFHPPVVEIVQIDHLADLGQRKTDILGPHDPGEPGAVALRINPGKAEPRGRYKPLVLVETQRACGASELTGQVGNGILLAAKFVRSLQMSPAVTTFPLASGLRL